MILKLITDAFIPVRIHVKEDAEAWKTVGTDLGVQWTPTILITDHGGVERHRIEGFLPAEDFLAQLALGLAKAASATVTSPTPRSACPVVEAHPKTETALEALYWAGVSRYKGTNDPTARKTPRARSRSATRSRPGRRSRRCGRDKPRSIDSRRLAKGDDSLGGAS